MASSSLLARKTKMRFPRPKASPADPSAVDLPAEEVGEIETLVLEISHHHFKSSEWEAEDDEIARLNRGKSLRLPDMALSRRVTVGFWVATLTFGYLVNVVTLYLARGGVA